MKSVLITSSLLILVLAALRPILRGKLDPRMQYALWLVAVLRLLVPVNLAHSAYSALALLDRAEEQTHLAQSIGQTNVPIPAMSYEDAYDQALREYLQDRPAAVSFTDLDEVELRARQLQAKAPTLAELTQKLARPVWLGGAALMAVWFLLVNLRLRRKLRAALPVEADCPLPVYVTPDLPSPCLRGAFQPAIYVTPAALADPDRLRHVLAHELTHYRHRDHWWALVRCLCLCLYWFDPLVWWAAALSRQDCELACDEGAIRRLGEAERLPYGRTLVAMIAAGRTPLLQTATTMTGGKRRVRERVQLIAQRPKTVAALALAAALLVGCAVGCTFTGAPEGADPDPARTQDPEPLSSDALNTATLPSRLLDVPDELWADVDANSGGGDPAVLAEYWMRRPWTRLDGSDVGFLLRVCTLTPEEYQEEFVGQANYGAECFARSDDTYYIIASPTDARYYTIDDEQDYFNAYDTILAYAIKTVLDTEGVEPFTPDPAVFMPNGLDYTLVTSYEDVPEDPEQWYLVGRLPQEPVWMFTRNRGEDTMFQIDGQLTQVFPYRACFYGGGYTPDGKAPQLMRLWGSGGRKGAYDGAFAVITHLFQGGTDQLYQLTAYDLDADPVAAYVHDWEALMEDFNENRTVRYNPIEHYAEIIYQRQRIQIDFSEAEWENVSRFGYDPSGYETSMSYTFNDDGTVNVIMPIWGPPIYSACWTIRFTGSGFETIGFRFIETSETDIW